MGSESDMSHKQLSSKELNEKMLEAETLPNKMYGLTAGLEFNVSQYQQGLNMMDILLAWTLKFFQLKQIILKHFVHFTRLLSID